MSYRSVVLKRGKEDMFARQHPWVFSGAVHKKDPDLEEGECVFVRSARDEIIGTGHYQNSSIMVRVLDFTERVIDQTFWDQRLSRALALRTQLFPNPEHTNAYRLIHGEGDFLPGLIIDYYNGHAVIQCHSEGMKRAIDHLITGLQTIYGDELKSIYDKSDTACKTSRFLWGDEAPAAEIKENDVSFYVNWEEGQKTGFFLDQRENRLLLGKMAKDRKILNLFSYTGGFSMAALHMGASLVESVDVSKKALEILEKNLRFQSDPQRHISRAEDVIHFLKNTDIDSFDIVIVDPPAFAKSVKKRHNAVQAYKRLNEMVFKKAKADSYVLTFSCSQVVHNQLFYDTIVSAGMETSRKIRVLSQLHQGKDHPINLFHPEGHYLKGLLVHIED